MAQHSGPAAIEVFNPSRQVGRTDLQIAAFELCENGQDDDCDGEVDEADDCGVLLEGDPDSPATDALIDLRRSLWIPARSTQTESS